MGYLVFTWKTHHPIFSGGKTHKNGQNTQKAKTKQEKKLILIAQHKMCAHFQGKSIFQTIYTLPSILLMRIKAGRNQLRHSPDYCHAQAVLPNPERSNGCVASVWTVSRVQADPFLLPFISHQHRTQCNRNSEPSLCTLYVLCNLTFSNIKLQSLWRRSYQSITHFPCFLFIYFLFQSVVIQRHS